MNDMEASIGLEGLKLFDQTFVKRRRTVMLIHEALKSYLGIIDVSQEDQGNVNCPHAYSITFKESCKHLTMPFKMFLDRNSIHWKRNFGCIPTQHGAFSYLNDAGKYPEAERVGDHGIHFGVHQYLSDEDVTYLIGTLTEFLGAAMRQVSSTGNFITVGSILDANARESEARA